MSESVGRVENLVSRFKSVKNNAFNDVSLDVAKTRATNIAIQEGVLRSNVGEFVNGKIQDQKVANRPAPDEIVTQEPTVEDIAIRMDKTADGMRKEIEQLGSGALEKWNILSEKAHLVESNTPEEALLVSETVVTKSEDLRQAKDNLAGKIIDTVQAEGLTGPTSTVLDINKESYISSLPYGERDAARSERITAKMLKEDPRFQAFRDAIVVKVQNLGETTKSVVDLKDLKGTWANLTKKGGLMNIWNRATVATKFAFRGDDKKQLYAHIDEAKIIAHKESELSIMPKLDAANVYLASFGDFQQEAQLTIESKAVLDAMPAVSRELQQDQASVLYDLKQDALNIDLAFEVNEAYDMNDAVDAEALKKERARLQKAMEKAGLDIAQRDAVAGMIEAKVKYLKESEARDEFADLELKANQLVESADKHAELASMGLTALHELQFSENKIAEFNASFSAEKMPDALEALVRGDMAKDLQEFVESNGKRGNDKAIRLLLVGTKSHLVPADEKKNFFGNEKEVAYQGMLEQVMFDPNNTDHFLTLNTLTQEGNAKDIVETGIQAAVAEDGTWQLRFATRKDGTIAVNENIPVVNLKPESIFAALSTIDAQEASLLDAQKALTVHKERYEAAVTIKATSATARRTAKGLVASSQSRVDELNKSIGASRAALAKELKVTNTGSSLAEAFTQMAEAQKEVAKDFYSADFREMVSGLAEELGMPQDKVTAEVLATLVVEATNASEQARQMAEFFNTVRTPGALEAHVVAEHMGEIDALSAEFARLQRNEQTVSQLDPGVARDKAAKEHAKERRTLDNEAKSLGAMLNQAFVEAVPAPLRKGTKATVISPTKFKQQVKETLDATGIDSGKYLKRGGALVDRVRADLPYNSELQVLTTQAADAIIGIEDTEARRILLKALDEGDVQEFNKQVNNLTARLTAEKFANNQAEDRANQLKEQLSTPEGVIGLMSASEEGWREAINAADEDNSIGAQVYEALLNANTPAAETVKAEACARFGRLVGPVIVLAGLPDTWVGGISPLSKRKDLVPQVDFLVRATSGDTKAYWQTVLDQINMEKKTPVETV